MSAPFPAYPLYYSIDKSTSPAYCNRMADEKLKKRIMRCLEILTAVLSRKGLNRNTLTAEYGCSIRTISEDIALLREIGFPIRYTKAGYTLSVSDLKIPPLPLQEEQIVALFIASQFLVLTPLEKKADEALQNMLAVLSEDAIAFLRNLTDRVYLAPGGDLGDSQILFDVYRAVSECQCIRIHYQAFSTQQEEIHDVNPYGIYLKDRASSYMVGYSFGEYQAIRRFKICRIKQLELRNMQFTYPPNFSIRQDMEHGFWSGAQTHDVVIRFRPDVAQLVREREPAERIEEQPGGWLLVRKTVRNIDEVFYGVLRYGRQAEILEPQTLREKMINELNAWQKVYSKS